MKRAIVLIVSAGALSSAASAQFFNLGPNVEPWSISDTGVVAALSPGHGGYAMWTEEAGIVGIGGALPGDGFGGTPSISADGLRIGGTNVNPDTGRGEMAWYDVTSGQWHNLGGIGGFSDFSTSSGWGISGDGQHVVGLGWVDAGTAHATRWAEGTGTVDMGSTVPGMSSRANGTDYDGSVVVGWQDGEFGGRNGAVWVDGVQTVILDGDGFNVGEAQSVSADGQWVTGIAFSNQSWRYNTVTTAFEYLEPVAGDFFFPTAFGTGISDDGSTIVGSVRDFGPPIFGTGVVWQDGAVMTLADFFTSAGVAYEPGFLFSVPLAISGDGLTYSGLGLSPSEGVIGWVVTVPTPGTAALLGLVAFAAGRRRR